MTEIRLTFTLLGEQLDLFLVDFAIGELVEVVVRVEDHVGHVRGINVRVVSLIHLRTQNELFVSGPLEEQFFKGVPCRLLSKINLDCTIKHSFALSFSKTQGDKVF